MRARPVLVLAGLLLAAHAASATPPIHLLLPEGLHEQLRERLPATFSVMLRHALEGEALVTAAASGEALVWIGPPEGLPPELWIRGFELSAQPIEVRVAENSPLHLSETVHTHARAQSAFLFPPKEFPKHNIDEEIRADFLPILEAYDRFGELIGYPGVLLSHVAPSLAGERFRGSQCYFFFFEDPATALNDEQWLSVLERIAQAWESRLLVERVETNYASYRPGERVQVRARIHNDRRDAASVVFRFSRRGPGDSAFQPITEQRRVAGGGSGTEAMLDFLSPGEPGLHHIRVEICQDARHATQLAVTGTPGVVSSREVGVVILEEGWQTPELLTVDGPNLLIEGTPAFLGGTHYYPSSVWWEWAWRDFRPAQADRDFWGMRRGANRIVRVWVDPVLDEPVLRAMDAAVWLAAQHGIVLDICVFNQWVRDLGFERPDGERVDFEFRHPDDFNLYSFSLRNLGLQREYVQTLARRYQRAGNLLYNLANETYIKDPDAVQMDAEAQQWDENAAPSGALRDSLLFRRWAGEMTGAIRAAGGEQLVFPGYLFTLHDGGDTYLANRNAPIMPWHGYFPPEWIGQTVHYFDPLCSGRPLLLEEFGALGWNPEEHYDAAMHYALAAGAGAAMSYEWGISWLAHEAPYVPLPIRDALRENPDPRWFAPIIDYARENAAAHGVGIAPWPSGFGYGSIYTGTPFQAAAARAVWRLASFGEHFPRASRPEEVYVVIPEAQFEAITPAQDLFKQLWLEGVQFGVWQAHCLGQLPDTARALLLPAALSAEDEAQLQAYISRGVTVYRPGEDGWRDRADIARVRFSPKGSINCLVRQTAGGRLYAFLGQQAQDTLEVALPEGELELGLREYAMVHAAGGAVSLIEAAGEVLLNGTPLFTAGADRVIAASADGAALDAFTAWDVVARGPTTLSFPRPVRRVQALVDGGTLAPDAQHRPGASTVTIDDELARYVLRLEFGE